MDVRESVVRKSRGSWIVWRREKGRVRGAVGRVGGDDESLADVGVDLDARKVTYGHGLKSAQRYFVSVRARGCVVWVIDIAIVRVRRRK